MYHYAGNNPVRYIDPTGLFEVDEETQTITADLSDKKDMQDAAKYLKKHDGYQMNAVFDNVTVNFKSYSDVKDYLGQTKQLNKIDYQSFISSLGNCAVEGQLFAYIGNFSKAANIIGNFASVVGFISLALEIPDMIKSLKDGDAFGIINFGVDGIIYGIGFAGVPGAAISLYLGTTKILKLCPYHSNR